MLHHFGRAESNGQPTFIGSVGNRASAKGDNIASPIANVQAGDVLVAFFSSVSVTVFTAGDGWTLRANLGGTNGTTAVYTKVATGSETSYTFIATDGVSFLAVLAYRNCEPCQIQIGALTEATSATQTGTSVTTTFQGTLLFYSFVETTATITTAPSGMTQRVFTSATSVSGSVYELANVSQTTVTGDKTIVYNASAQGAGVLVQIKTAQRQVIVPQYVAQANANSATGASVTINKPTGTQENDIMIAAVRSSSTSGVTWSSSGWTAAFNANGFGVLYKVAGASEGASYTFSSSSGTASQGGIATFRYCSYDTVGTVASGGSTVYPNVTTATKYELCVATAARQAATTWTAPAGMTTVFSLGTSPAVILSYITAVGNGTFNGTAIANSSTNLAAVALALKGLVTS